MDTSFPGLGLAGNGGNPPSTRGAEQYGDAHMLAFSLNVETHTGPKVEARFDQNIAILDATSRVIKMKDTSVHALATLIAEHSEPFDVIYIDGSHAPKEVLTDAILSWPLLKQHGVLIFDDYKWDEHVPIPAEKAPRKGIDAFLDIFAEEFTLLVSSYQCIVQKK